MAFLVLTAADIERVLPMDECIDVMAEALADLERGRTSQPLRSVFVPPGVRAAMAWMPAHRSGEDALFGMKVLCLLPGNPKRGLDAHQGQVLLSDGGTGQLRALLDASTVTAIRTAAVSGLATRLLARADASVLGVIGTGVQARRHLEAIAAVRPIRTARIAGRTPERAREFVREVAPGLPFALEAVASAEDAVRGASLVVTATSSREPVLRREWLEPGTHVNAVGASQPTHRELDVETVVDSRLYTDRRQSLEHEAIDYRLALEQERITPAHVIGELGELLTGAAEGRRSDEDLTLFRSLGLAVEDMAAAEHALRKARELGVGVEVEF